jgi:hypothetical protein
LKRFLALTLVLLLAGPALGIAFPRFGPTANEIDDFLPDSQDVWRSIDTSGVVQVRVFNSVFPPGSFVRGTGWLIKGNGAIGTAAHLFHNMKTPFDFEHFTHAEIEFAINGTNYEFTVSNDNLVSLHPEWDGYTHNGWDVATVKLDEAIQNVINPTGVQGYFFESPNVGLGDYEGRIVMAGWGRHGRAFYPDLQYIEAHTHRLAGYNTSHGNPDDVLHDEDPNHLIPEQFRPGTANDRSLGDPQTMLMIDQDDYPSQPGYDWELVCGIALYATNPCTMNYNVLFNEGGGGQDGPVIDAGENYDVNSWVGDSGGPWLTEGGKVIGSASWGSSPQIYPTDGSYGPPWTNASYGEPSLGADLTQTDMAFQIWLSSFHGTQKGDADNDGDVDGTDLIKVQQHYGNTGLDDGFMMGDADDNGYVNGSDLIAVQQFYGQNIFDADGCGTGCLFPQHHCEIFGCPTAPVPSPSSALTILGSILLLARRR